MRILGLLLFALALLTVEGALGKVFHLELLRPDLVLILVIWLAFRDYPGTPFVVFALGMVADSFAGAPTGMLTSIYLLIWGLTRAAQGFLLSNRILVQVATLFVMSLLSNIVLAVGFHLLAEGGNPVLAILIWAVPLSLLNVVLAGPIWVLAKRIMGHEPAAAGLALPG